MICLHFVEAAVKAADPYHRSTFRALAESTGIASTMLWRLVRAKTIRRRTSRAKPMLTDKHKAEREGENVVSKAVSDLWSLYLDDVNPHQHKLALTKVHVNKCAPFHKLINRVPGGSGTTTFPVHVRRTSRSVVSLDPRHIGDGLPADSRRSVEEVLINSPVDDITPIDGNRKEKLYIQFTTCFISAAGELLQLPDTAQGIEDRDAVLADRLMSVGFIHSKLRNSLSAKTVEKLMFIKNNMGAFYSCPTGDEYASESDSDRASLD
ncbi:hypothetical protein H310_04227 [Aphanomyces invadans]|uniref:Uncharacterized protein n=1 Tax=Aphanomyces invadans TaxID=157072 RepID=A0A024UI12_9STRA|nr:hypothetical protein H310_04227 [Aphanomyces invadans]ETW05263.1 hypothetical protein H310_04227 [Aphanomyces invadans]|eukprot:XP_008866701.1 hypothetical protein H310_04227 [Aphanomyces invadans]